MAETEAPGVGVSAVARRHAIVTGLLFRWRAQFGVAAKAKARLARVARGDEARPVVALQALVPSPDGMAAVDLPGGRRVFAPAGAEPDTVRAQLDSKVAARC